MPGDFLACPPCGHAGSVKILRDILDFWGVNTCNTKRVGRLVESADATSHFVTRIKKKKIQKT